MNGCRIRHEAKASVGGAAVQFDTVEKHRFDGEYGNIQVVCSVLDGGTFSVEGLCPDQVWRVMNTGSAEADVAHFSDAFHILALRVKFAALGVGAAPSVHVSLMGRTLRYSS